MTNQEQSPQQGRLENDQPQSRTIRKSGPSQILKSQVSEYLNKRGCNSLKPAKSILKTSRKQKMRTVEYYVCDNCDQPILSPNSGYIIQGNIYTADPRQRGGLIGNNIPQCEGSVDVSQIRETVLCRKCLTRTLGFGQSSTAIKPSGTVGLQSGYGTIPSISVEARSGYGTITSGTIGAGPVEMPMQGSILSGAIDDGFRPVHRRSGHRRPGVLGPMPESAMHSESSAGSRLTEETINDISDESLAALVEGEQTPF